MTGVAWVSYYIALPAAFWAALIFISTYTVLAPWWRTSIGRTIVAMDAGIMLTLLPAVLHLYLGVSEGSPSYAWFTLCAFLLVPSSILWRTWVMVRVHRLRPLSPRGRPAAESGDTAGA